MNLSVNLSVNSSFQQILVIWTLFINLKALNTIGRHVPNVLVIVKLDYKNVLKLQFLITNHMVGLGKTKNYLKLFFCMCVASYYIWSVFLVPLLSTNVCGLTFYYTKSAPFWGLFFNNKKYWVVRSAWLTHSRNTCKLTPKFFLIN